MWGWKLQLFPLSPSLLLHSCTTTVNFPYTLKSREVLFSTTLRVSVHQKCLNCPKIVGCQRYQVFSLPQTSAYQELAVLPLPYSFDWKWSLISLSTSLFLGRPSSSSSLPPSPPLLSLVLSIWTSDISEEVFFPPFLWYLPTCSYSIPPSLPPLPKFPSQCQLPIF